MFSVNLIVYGDHPDLAARCLGSIVNSADPELVAEVRVGMNAVCEATRDLVLSAMHSAPLPFLVYEEVTGANVMKYPLMRRMIYDPARPIPTEKVDRVMWFDDDSYVIAGHRFWADADHAFRTARCPVMGSVYFPGFYWTPAEKAAYRQQPWYTGQLTDTQTKFVTGGWWVADLEFLSKWDYPFRELKHNGGDTVLGEVLRQQKLRPHHFRDGVAVNADATGRESKAVRRGVTTKRAFELPPPYDYTHHDFKVRVLTNGHGEGER